MVVEPCARLVGTQGREFWIAVMLQADLTPRKAPGSCVPIQGKKKAGPSDGPGVTSGLQSATRSLARFAQAIASSAVLNSSLVAQLLAVP